MPISLSPEAAEFEKQLDRGFEISDEELRRVIGQANKDTLDAQGIDHSDWGDAEYEEYFGFDMYGNTPDGTDGTEKETSSEEPANPASPEETQKRMSEMIAEGKGTTDKDAKEYYDSYFKGVMQDPKTNFGRILAEHEKNIGAKIPYQLRHRLENQAYAERAGISAKETPEQQKVRREEMYNQMNQDPSYE